MGRRKRYQYGSVIMFTHERVGRGKAIGSSVGRQEGVLLGPVRPTLYRAESAFQIVPGIDGINPFRTLHPVDEQEGIGVPTLQSSRM